MRNLLSFRLWHETSYIHIFYLIIDMFPSMLETGYAYIHNFDRKMGMFPSMILNRV